LDYVRNRWYPLTWSRDVGRSLIKRKIVGENVVLYRTLHGHVVALRDACPHRLAPLSLGKLKGDAIECGYHGMTFDGGGTCIRIPGQEIIPGNARVRAYPTAERMGLVWIWMADAALADPALIYHLPQHDDPRWSTAYGDALEIKTNYLNLADNLCDPAHVSFVHLSTLGNAASEDIPVQHRLTDDGVLVWRWIKDAPPIPIFAKYGNFTGNVDRWHYYHFIAPNIAMIDFGSAATGEITDEADRVRGMQIFACHFITPVDETSCIDHWLHVRNFSQGDAAVDQRLHGDFRVAFNEDKEILEAIEQQEMAYPGFPKIRLGIDAAPMRMRRKVETMMEAERKISQPG
jgi:phenylpropionate dioxygenase-like ring-hydroxylating dioxygenase large terminal subunit